MFRFLEKKQNQAIYHLFLPTRIHGEIDSVLLEKSIQCMIERHENLRASFEDTKEGPIRRVAESINFSLPIEDLTTLTEPKRDARIKEIFEEFRHKTFDLKSPPLFAAKLILSSPSEAFFLVLVSHLITDAWGLNILHQELTEQYEALLENRAPALPEIKIKASDYAIAADNTFRAILAKGKDAYPPYPAESFRFPYDQPHPAQLNIEGKKYNFIIEEALKERLLNTGRAYGFSLSGVCITAFQVALHRLSKQEQVLFAVLHGNRRSPAMRDTVGCFVYSELFHGAIKPNNSYQEILQNTNRFIFEERLEEQPRVSVMNPPQLRIVFNFHNFEMIPSRLEYAPEYDTYNYIWDVHDLFMQLFPAKNGIVCEALYRSEVIYFETIEKLAKYFVETLQEIAIDPKQTAWIAPKPASSVGT